MLESPRVYQSLDVSSERSLIAPAIDANGRIRLPGFPAGLSIQAYLPLMHRYANILEASRILDRYRASLRLLPGNNAPQAPLTALTPSTQIPGLFYKREDQTVTRAYKVRGAVVSMAKQMESHHRDRFITVSTGNHALGVLQAAFLLQPKAVRLVVPENTALLKLEKLQQAIDGLNATRVQADLILRGKTFDDARAWAQDHTQPNEAYIDPYADPWVVAGQGTVGLELVEQIGQLLTQSVYKQVQIIAPVGGGGLLTGTATALSLGAAWEPTFRNVALQFTGLRLDDLQASLGDAIRVAEIAPENFSAFKSLDVEVQAMSDSQIAQGVAFVAQDLGCRVEGASGGTVWPVLQHAQQKQRFSSDCLTVCLLSGGNCAR